MSTYTIIGWGAFAVACIAFAATCVSLAYLAFGRDKGQRASREHHWPTFRARSQAWLTARYGPSKNVPALVPASPQDSPASAGTSNVTVDPRAAVALHGPARAESGRAEPPVPGRAVELHHYVDHLAEHIAAAWEHVTPNQRQNLWQPHHQPEYADQDTGYSRDDRDQLRALLIDDHAAATVQIRRRFADLEVRDQARFARITAGIKAGAA